MVRNKLYFMGTGGPVFYKERLMGGPEVVDGKPSGLF